MSARTRLRRWSTRRGSRCSTTTASPRSAVRQRPARDALVKELWSRGIPVPALTGDEPPWPPQTSPLSAITQQQSRDLAAERHSQ